MRKHSRESVSAGKRRLAKSASTAIFLVGFMGAGKSSVGRTLARHLNWTFEDLDDRIEGRAHCSIAEIFRTSGEAAFREVEREALRRVLDELASGAAKVVALGGGAFAQKANIVMLERSGVPTVFLDAPVAELWRRCCEQTVEVGTSRPLLKSFDQFDRLHADRRPSYLSASLTVDTAGQTIEAIAAGIVKAMGLRRPGAKKGAVE